MTPADLVVLVAATTSLTRLMTHDTITAPVRAPVMRRGSEGTIYSWDKTDAPRPDGPRWEPLDNGEGLVVGWYRRPAWYARMLRCPRFCAPMWAGAAVAAGWTVDRGPCRAVVLALGLRGLHAALWPLVANQFEGS